ncbi:MAG: ABC transporter ATP-binding protein [Gemmatimonadetes bacterium]|nr:ABC transporter ATP-binding protein [Gemmatimonadota bacterium]
MSTPTPAVSVRALTKRFGNATALDRVEFDVPAGSVFGFLGPNGAGKTTLLRILTGLARPTSGTASVFGVDLGERGTEIRRRIGFLPDVPGFYPWMTAAEFVSFAGRLVGVDVATLPGRVEALLDLAGLNGVSTRIGGYSRGMKQRLGVAQALVGAPDLLLLDEPTSALDPIGRREVLEMIASLRGRTTVFFSTHILADVERVCDTVAILDRGRLAAFDTVADLKRRAATERISIVVDGDAAELCERLRSRPWVQAIDRDGATLRIVAADLALACREVPEAVASLRLGLRRFEVDEASLEEVFVRVVGEKGR